MPKTGFLATAATRNPVRARSSHSFEKSPPFVVVILLAKKKIVFDEILVFEDVPGEILVVEDVLEVVVVNKEVLNAALVEEKTKQKAKKDHFRVS